MECFYYIKKMLPASGIELALSFAPVSALLNGGGVPVICSAPVSECWPELGVKSQDVLRRATVRRRCRLCARLSSGEEDPAGELVVAPFPPVSALLNGGGVPVICSPPVSECWPELGVKSQDVLRRAMVRRRCKLCARLSSGEEDPAGELVVAPFPPVSAHLIGGGVPVICSAPVSECWPELGVKSQDVLRRAMVRRRCRLCARLSSGEESPTGVGLAQNIRRCMNLPRPSKSPR